MKIHGHSVLLKLPSTRTDSVVIRGHTLLCLQGFRGEGYDSEFIDNMLAIHTGLREEPTTRVLVSDTPDHFCAACPNLKGGPQFDSAGRSGREAAGSSHASQAPALAPAEPDARFSPGAAAGQASGSASDWPGRGGIASQASRLPHSDCSGGIGGTTAPHGPPEQKAGCTLRGPNFEQHIVSQDRQVLELLDLKVGQEVTWAEVLDRIGSRMRGEMLDGICGDCQWLSLGYCKEGIERLHHSTNAKRQG